MFLMFYKYSYIPVCIALSGFSKFEAEVSVLTAKWRGLDDKQDGHFTS